MTTMQINMLGAGTPLLTRTGNDLTFSVRGVSKTAKGWFDPDSTGYYGLYDSVTFLNGYKLPISALTGKPLQWGGTNGADTLTGWNGIDIVRGLGGNDIILGAGGNDSLYGDAGNDTLDGGAGNDMVDGGAGDDFIDGGDGDDWVIDLEGSANVLLGGQGNDIISGQGTITGGAGNDQFFCLNNTSDRYIYSKGDGKDIIWDEGVKAATDTLTLQQIASSDLKFTRKGSDMVINTSSATDSDSITIAGWFTGEGREIENIEFRQTTQANGWGTTLSWTDPFSSLIKGSNFRYDGLERGEVIRGCAGTDNIDGKGGNDTIFGLKGDDFLNGGAGNDIITGGEGTDTVNVAEGDDTVVFGSDDIGTWNWTYDMVEGFAPGQVIAGVLTGGDKLNFNLKEAGSAANYRESTVKTSTSDTFKTTADAVLSKDVKYFVQSSSMDTYVGISFNDDGNCDMIVVLTGLKDGTALQPENFVA